MKLEERRRFDPADLRVARAVALSTGLREGVHPLHAEQVAELAGELAAELELSEPAARRCRLGGLLHDVGKVVLPDAVLSKPGPLAADEWDVMRQHTIAGERIVAGLHGLEDVASTVRHHHERWDGGGYPDRLAGEAIPIEARIVGCADAYSAMTVDRVYRRHITHDRALAEIADCAGAHFDPHVADALLAVMMRRMQPLAVRARI